MYSGAVAVPLLIGKVEQAGNKEYGRADITVEDPDSALFKGLPSKQYVWMSHGDLVRKIKL